jgi:hypothetical protein
MRHIRPEVRVNPRWSDVGNESQPQVVRAITYWRRDFVTGTLARVKPQSSCCARDSAAFDPCVIGWIISLSDIGCLVIPLVL